jgi:hypothetical protein
MSSPETIVVRPARQGLRVRLPQIPARIVPEKGCRVQLTNYIRRRIADGDLVEVTTAKPVKTKKTAEVES